MIIGHSGTTISNDGATIINYKYRTSGSQKFSRCYKSQDNEVGDGTTSVMIFAGELLKEERQFIENG